MRNFAAILLVAGILAACSGVVIGPVDHSCAVNPQFNQGSGCGEHGGSPR